jgi:hypothetical protein
MRKLLLALLALLTIVVRRAHAQSDSLGLQDGDTVQVQVVTQQGDTVPTWLTVNDDLPAGVLGTTHCGPQNRPLVEVRHDATFETVLHEMVHVQQLQQMGHGDCAFGLKQMVRNKYTLLAAEAEAYCTEARWVEANGGPSVEQSMNLAAGWVYEASVSNKDQSWALTSEEVHQKFNAQCPTQVQQYEPGTTSYTNAPVTRVLNPLTNTVVSSEEKAYYQKN